MRMYNLYKITHNLIERVIFYMEKQKKKIDENELLKYEIANELGLLDKVNTSGWRSLTAKESGRIGGLISKKKREKKQQNEENDS